jgi:hypothetical protein
MWGLHHCVKSSRHNDKYFISQSSNVALPVSLEVRKSNIHCYHTLLFLVICGMISMQLCPRQLLCFCRRLGAFAMHISMVLLLMFLSPPLTGAGPMALMLGHDWQHIYTLLPRTCIQRGHIHTKGTATHIWPVMFHINCIQNLPLYIYV